MRSGTGLGDCQTQSGEEGEVNAHLEPREAIYCIRDEPESPPELPHASFHRGEACGLAPVQIQE